MGFTERYGPWALIAGASEGLGAAYAEQAALRGLNLFLVARRSALLEETAADYRARFPIEVRTLAVDLSNPDASDTVIKAVGALDVGLFIYNAAAAPQGRFIATSKQDLAFNIAVNCTTPTMLTQDVAERMVKRGHGGIVLIASMAALQGIKIFTHYGAAKAYELILGEGLWDEMRDHGIEAFSYVVGSTATPNWNNNARMAKPGSEAMAKIAEMDALSRTVAAPRSPQEVAERLFAVLDRQGANVEPRHYSHSDDEAHAIAAAKLSRSQVVETIGRATSATFE